MGIIKPVSSVGIVDVSLVVSSVVSSSVVAGSVDLVGAVVGFVVGLGEGDVAGVCVDPAEEVASETVDSLAVLSVAALSDEEFS